MCNHQHYRGPDPDDAPLPEPWPESDVETTPAAHAAVAIVTDADPEADDVGALARAWDAPSARGKGPTTDEEEGEGDEARPLGFPHPDRDDAPGGFDGSDAALLGDLAAADREAALAAAMEEAAREWAGISLAVYARGRRRWRRLARACLAVGLVVGLAAGAVLGWLVFGA